MFVLVGDSAADGTEKMRFNRFKVTNYRNVVDSGWIRVTSITAIVGPNESGKSNYFEALYRINPFQAEAVYNIDEDWPVDNWSGKNPNAVVCVAEFEIDEDEVVALFESAQVAPPQPPPVAEGEAAPPQPAPPPTPPPPKNLTIIGERRYTGATAFKIVGEGAANLDPTKVHAWAKDNVPKFVYIYDYEFSGNYIELNALAHKLRDQSWNALTNEEQTILIVLQLAKIDINDFVAKGDSPQGRTQRSYDKRSASQYLSAQFEAPPCGPSSGSRVFSSLT